MGSSEELSRVLDATQHRVQFGRWLKKNPAIERSLYGTRIPSRAFSDATIADGLAVLARAHHAELRGTSYPHLRVENLHYYKAMRRLSWVVRGCPQARP